MDQDGVEFHKHAKRKEVNIQPSYPHAWSIKDLLYSIRNKFLLRDIACQFRAGKIASSVQDSAILPAKRASHIISNISNTRDSVSSGYPNTEKRVENTTRSGVFLTNFEVFG